MKQFLKRISISILPILVIGIVFEILIRKIPNDYSYKKDYLDSNSRKIEILFLGSSHAFFGINPAYIKSLSFNAAEVSQYLNYDLEILKKYDNKWDSLKYIAIPVDYFSLYGKLENGIEAWRVKNYTIYYGINISNKISDYSEMLNNNLQVNASQLFNFYFKQNSNITCTQLGWGTRYSSKNNQDLTITGKAAASRHRSKNDIFFNENVGYLKSIIEFANEKNIKVILYTFPAYKTYLQNLDSTQLSRTINVAANAAKTYSNTLYFNFMRDTAFTANDFYDADHLNEIGAKKFTLKIDSLIMVNKKG